MRTTGYPTPQSFTEKLGLDPLRRASISLTLSSCKNLLPKGLKSLPKTISDVSFLQSRRSKVHLATLSLSRLIYQSRYTDAGFSKNLDTVKGSRYL